jgi:hypothetical protein
MDACSTSISKATVAMTEALLLWLSGPSTKANIGPSRLCPSSQGVRRLKLVGDPPQAPAVHARGTPAPPAAALAPERDRPGERALPAARVLATRLPPSIAPPEGDCGCQRPSGAPNPVFLSGEIYKRRSAEVPRAAREWLNHHAPPAVSLSIDSRHDQRGDQHQEQTAHVGRELVSEEALDAALLTIRQTLWRLDEAQGFVWARGPPARLALNARRRAGSRAAGRSGQTWT